MFAGRKAKQSPSPPEICFRMALGPGVPAVWLKFHSRVRESASALQEEESEKSENGLGEQVRNSSLLPGGLEVLLQVLALAVCQRLKPCLRAQRTVGKGSSSLPDWPAENAVQPPQFISRTKHFSTCHPSTYATGTWLLFCRSSPRSAHQILVIKLFSLSR